MDIILGAIKERLKEVLYKLPGLLVLVAWNDLFLDHGNRRQFLLKMKMPGGLGVAE